jgi:hypothetical protein
MAVAVGLFAAISLDQIALAGVAVLGSLIYNGFLEDRFGQLAWHGTDDLWGLLLLVIVGAGGLALGESVRFVANLRARRTAEFDRAEEETSSTGLWTDEMSRSAALGSSNGHLPGWASDLASAAELAGWSGPRPVDVRLTDAGRADTDPPASRDSLANRPTPGPQASP